MQKEDSFIQHQVGYYRSRAITKEYLKDDKGLLKFWFKKYGFKGKIPSDFVGFEAYGGRKVNLLLNCNKTY
jgi:hypothetical protein